MHRSSLALALFLTSSLAQAQLPPPPAPPENPITPEKALLGKILFWEEQLSSDNSMACGTCHMPSLGGQDPRAEGPSIQQGVPVGGGPRHPGPDGILGTPDDAFGSAGLVRTDSSDDYLEDALFGFAEQVTGRSSPDFMGTAWNDALFWDGRATSTFIDPQTGLVSIPSGGALESQAVGPVLSDVEMAHMARDWDAVTAKLEEAQPLGLASDLPPDVATLLGQHGTYPELFAHAFGSPEVTAERIAYAIATYERTLVPDQTPYDLYMGGDTSAMTALQLEGLDLFRGARWNCAACHEEPLFHNDRFHALGLTDPQLDPGRQAVTGFITDRGKFKTPGLRNTGLRQQMMHDGSRRSIFDVLNLYIEGGGPFDDNKDHRIAPFQTNQHERNAVTAFLHDALTDPRAAFELPPFDRPTLASENPQRKVQRLGGGIAGSSGEEPLIIASTPPAASAPGFKLGVARARGGAPAFLVMGSPASNLGVGGPLVRSLLWRTQPVFLPGTGAADGYSTQHFTSAALLPLAGLPWRAQWWILDPGAPGGFARSEAIEFTPF